MSQRLSRTLRKPSPSGRAWVAAAALLFSACGDGGGGGSNGTGVCGFGSEDYLPLEPGQRWSYRVTDTSTAVRTNKVQSLEAAPVHPDYGEVVRQVTLRADGRTESLFGRDGDAIVRFEETRYNLAGGFEVRERYVPPRLRLDGSAARLVSGAMYEQSLVVIEEDEQGNVLSSQDRVEQWEVLGVDVECSSPLGSFECLHLSRSRGGVTDKEFQFARGIGKVLESGGQIEELTDCGVE